MARETTDFTNQSSTRSPKDEIRELGESLAHEAQAPSSI